MDNTFLYTYDIGANRLKRILDPVEEACKLAFDASYNDDELNRELALAVHNAFAEINSTEKIIPMPEDKSDHIEKEWDNDAKYNNSREYW